MGRKTWDFLNFVMDVWENVGFGTSRREREDCWFFNFPSFVFFFFLNGDREWLGLRRR